MAAPSPSSPGSSAVLVPVATLRPGIRELVRKQFQEIPEDGFIPEDVFLACRLQYIQRLIQEEVGEIGELEEEVVDSLNRDEILSTNIEEEIEEKLTLGQRLADYIAEFGGSWTFLSVFFVFLVIWMVINVAGLFQKPFDPFPFILLNLILSCIAAVQAPVIMMSQNRLNEKDRARAEHDYQINLKSEIEIRALHEKMDHLLTQQWRRLVEVQKVQLELLQELRAK